jgi:hypothetical protein
MKRPKITKVSLPKVKREIKIQALIEESDNLIKENKSLNERIKLQEETIKRLEDQRDMLVESCEHCRDRIAMYFQLKKDVYQIYLDLQKASELSTKDAKAIVDTTENPDDSQAVSLQVAAHCYRRVYSKIMAALKKHKNSMNELAKDYQQAESKEQEAKAFSYINIHRGAQAGAED